MYGFRGRPRLPVGGGHHFRTEAASRIAPHRRILIGRDQLRDPAVQRPLTSSTSLADRLGRPFPGDDRHAPADAPGPTPRGPSSRRVESIPGLILVAVLFLLADERPLLVELELAGLGGVGDQVVVGGRGRACRRRGCSG